MPPGKKLPTSGHSFSPMAHTFCILREQPRTENNAIYVGSLDSKERTLLLNANSNALYSPPGYLLYHREGTLMAQPFDAERIQLTGEPVPIAEGLQFDPATVVQLLRPPRMACWPTAAKLECPLRTLVWVDRTGTEQAVAAPPRAYTVPSFPPTANGWRVEIGPQIWLHDLTRGTLTRFTFEGTKHKPALDAGRQTDAFQSDKEGPPTKCFGNSQTAAAGWSS